MIHLYSLNSDVLKSMLFIILLLLIFLISIVNLSISSGSDELVLEESIRQTCIAAAGGRSITIKGTKAEFFDGNANWTIVGANQQQVESIMKPERWSLKNDLFQILVVKEPISDVRILPFSDPVPNTLRQDRLKIRAWRGEYEPASFVLRAGNHPLKDVTVNPSDLNHEKGHGYISSENIDVRVVKCWYQAGLGLYRRKDDKKRLTPELLLHDNDIVRVDYKNYVNLIKNYPYLKDANKLIPFEIPKKTNQQLWVTIKIPEDCEPGEYTGEFIIRFMANNKAQLDILPVSLHVDPRIAPPPPIDYSLFYLARYYSLNKGLGARSKNQKQLEGELRDMKAHNLTNVALDYVYLRSLNGEVNYKKFEPMLRAMRGAGFDTNKLLFVDWKLGGAEDTKEYISKLDQLKVLAKKHGFSEIYIYNNDEKDFHELMKKRQTFEIAHQLGLKNFVACRIQTASQLIGLLDVAVLPRNTASDSVKDISKQNTKGSIIPWAYNTPQAGMEIPETYRKVYGLSLLKDGFQGVCNYAYQSGDCWDDWADKKWRPHVMAYPTQGDPIPTIQWEGFREGIDDVRKAGLK